MFGALLELLIVILCLTYQCHYYNRLSHPSELDHRYDLILDAETEAVILTRDTGETTMVDLTPAIADLMDNYSSTGSTSVPKALMEIETQGDALGVKLVFSKLTLINEDGQYDVTHLEGSAFVRLEND